MSTRTPCLVPFCGCTTSTEKLRAKGHDEWICVKHWRGVPQGLRRLKFRYAKLIKAGQDTPRVRQYFNRVWRRCKRSAIERAGGIS